MLEVRSVGKTYGGPQGTALHDVSYRFLAGTVTAIVGKSGSGKTTLLKALAGVLSPTNGVVAYDDVDIYALRDRQLATLRAQKSVYVAQDYNLLDFLTAAENVRLALQIAGIRDDSRVLPALSKVGLSDFADKKPDQLSGGQCQRVAIARALAVAPPFIFADEPTGALDDDNAAKVLDLFRESAQNGTTVVLVTHDVEIAAGADIVLELSSGEVSHVLESPSLEAIVETMYKG